jgi:hypothetical protein
MMSKRNLLIIILAAILAFGCVSTPAPTATPGSTATPAPPQPVDTSRAGGFADYVPVMVDVVPDAPGYVPDLGVVVNADVVTWLSDGQKAALEENGFVVVPRGHEQIYQIYQQADEASIPAFVTTDAVLHAYHILYDYSLRLAEMEHFIADLEALNVALLAAAEADYAATDGPVRQAAWQNLAYFAVATKLLTPDAGVPEPVRDVVEEELALIDAHKGFEISPIFDRYRADDLPRGCKHRFCEDYSQYVPRGHYTRNEDFERYFRAMMWYGRMSFHLSNPYDPDAGPRETRSALLIVRALHTVKAGGEPALDVWDRIYEPTAFFVGTADDLTVYDYAAVASEIYGGLPDAHALADEAQLEAFIEVAQALRPPAIVGGFVTDTQDAEEMTMGFRFMGQRFIPDSYMFQQLVYDEVSGTYRGSGAPFTLSPSGVGPIRGFPRGLDVPAVLGSERALEILTAEGDTDYDGYDEQLAKLQDEFATLPGEQWTENLYWNWLHTLRPLLDEKGEGYPYFMQSPVWVDKDLHAWLGSWTELRHDTILYAKQSYTVFAETAMEEPEPAYGYVEPQTEVYARLAALTAQMQAGLGGRGLLNDEIAAKLAQMEQLLLSLKTISEKELRGESLTEEEYTLIRYIGDTLEDLTTFSEEIDGEVSSEADERMALVADVHTDSNTGKVLEEGVGDAFPIYVVVMVEGEQVVAMGGVFSYYEFKQPMSDRLTDEAWQAMSPKPDRPAWTTSFIVE